MSTYSKVILSGSTDGKGIKITQTALASGDTIHTAAGLDIVTLYVSNPDTSSHTLKVGWGGTTTIDNEIIQTVAAQSGLSLVIADLPIQNSLVIKASADTANKIVIYGSVNRIA